MVYIRKSFDLTRKLLENEKSPEFIKKFIGNPNLKLATRICFDTGMLYSHRN